MPSKPAEPEKYSLDEMLDRLQEKPASGVDPSGELVVRADGTQAIKVRKRKRRSTQPHKEEKKRSTRIQAIQIASAIVLLALLGFAFGGLIVYANSAPYRRAAVEKISSVTGAETQLTQLRVTPTGANAVVAEFKWPAGNPLKSLSLTGVRAKALIVGLVGEKWGIDEISVTTGKLHIDTPEKDQPFRNRNTPTGGSLIEMKRLGVEKLDIIVGDPANPALQILNTEASLYPETPSGRPSVRLFRGDLNISSWPLLRVDRALVEFQGPDTEIVSLRLLHKSDPVGTIELSGKFDPHTTEKTQALGVRVDSFSLDGITGASLGRLVAGRVDTRDVPGSNQLTFSTSRPGGGFSFAFTSTPGSPLRLNDFAFLDFFAKVLDNRWFIDPTFDEGSGGILHRENGLVRFTDLSLIAKTQLTVTGDLTMQPDEALAGTLKVGLPEAFVIASIDPKLKKMFGTSGDSIRWITLKISGTASHPTDNFSEIYESSGTAIAPGPGSLFDDLTTPRK